MNNFFNAQLKEKGGRLAKEITEDKIFFSRSAENSCFICASLNGDHLSC